MLTSSQSSIQSAQRLLKQKTAKLEVHTANERQVIPNEAKKLLGQILDALEHGKKVQILETETILTTHQAAKLLDVSRPHFIGLLERGEIKYFKVGSHRRVQLSDVQAYKEHRKTARLETLRQLSAEAQKLGLGY
jgi:excisionase family DNA binding protein